MKSPLGLEARIPVFDLFKDALFLLWAKRGRLLSMFLPIIVVLVILDRYSATIAEPISGLVGADADTEYAGLSLEFWVVSGISFFLTALLATTVHRFTLQDSSLWPGNALRVPTISDLRYVLRLLQIFAVLSISFILLATVMELIFPGAYVAFNEMLIGKRAPQLLPMVIFYLNLLLPLYVAGRLSVTLPEVAIGAKGSSMRRSWKMSKGNGWRLLVVVLILPFVVSLPFFLLIGSQNIVTTVLALFGFYFMTIVSTTVLSLSYQFLFEFYEPDPEEEVIPEKDDNDGMDA